MENQENVKKKRTWKPRPVMPKFMGVVTSWDKYKKYGFIRCYEDGNSYFVHCTALKNDRELIRGSIVEFEIWTDEDDPEKKFANYVLVCEVPEERRTKYQNRWR